MRSLRTQSAELVAMTAAVMSSSAYMRAPGMHAAFTLTAPRRHASTTRVVRAESKEQRYSRLGMDGFTDVTYNTAADLFLEHLDNVLEDIDTTAIEDVNLSGGVLSIETTSKGTFVLNKQAPNVQLWLSSPLSGPHHYDMMLPVENNNNNNNNNNNVIKAGDVQWIADSDGHSLRERLERELTDTLGVENTMVESQADEKNNLMLTKSGGATSNGEHPQEFQLPQTEAFMNEEKNGPVATASVDAPHAPPHRLSLRAQVSDATAGRHGKVVLTPRRASGDEMQNNHAKKDLAKMDNDADDFSDLGSTDPEAEATVPVPLPHTGTFVTTCRKKFDGSGWAALLSSVHDTVERTLLNEAARATGLPEVNIRVVDMAMDGASTLVAELALVRDAAVSPESLDAALDAYSFPGMKALLEVKESADSHQPTGLGAAMQGMMERSNGITAESKDEEINFVDVKNGEHEEDLHHAILSDTDGDSNVGHDDDNADVNRSGNSNNDNNAAAAEVEVEVEHPKAKNSKKTRERVAKGMSSPRAVGAAENGAASPMTRRRAGKKYRKATLKNNDQSSPQKQKKLMTPWGGTPTPRAGLSTPRGGTPTPRAGLSTPRGGTPTPRAGLSTPRGGTPTPRAGLSTPRGGTPTLRAGLSTPRGGTPTLRAGLSTPRGGTQLLHNSTRFISSMLPWASRPSYAPRFSSHQQPQLMVVGTSADHNTRQRHRSSQRISPMRSHSLRRASGSDVHSSFGNQSTDMNSSHASRKQHACVRRGSIRPVPPQRVIRVGSPCCSRTPRCSGEPSHVSAMPHLHKAQDTTQPQTTGYTSIALTTPVWDHDPEPQTCMIIPAENTMASVDLRSERNRSPLEKTPGVSRRSRSPNVPVVSQTSPHRADTEE